jgi:hypothetical protein
MFRRAVLGIVLLFVAAAANAQSSAIVGRVASEGGRPVSGATVAARSESVSREAVTDSAGAFRFSALAAGLYTLTVRRVGYRSAEITAVRVAIGQTVSLEVTLTQAARQLSTIHVVTSPISVDVGTPELSLRLDRTFTELLPSARDASSLIALIPGARREQLWGGAPGITNDYQLDGVSMNHPGIGGDFLSLSVDWVETLDIRGLGAGAEHGNFQGGIINAITKTGTNDRRFAFRTNYESPKLTSSNFNVTDVGSEQAGRQEVSGEALGALSRDKLFYFAAGQFVRRDLRSLDLSTPADGDFQSVQEGRVEGRGLAKLTWLPALGQRADFLAGFSTSEIENAGINGLDDPSATQRVARPTSYFQAAWSRTPDARRSLDIRVAGFTSRETRDGYEGTAVPGIRIFQLGRQPGFQNAVFTERTEPSSLAGSITQRVSGRAFGVDHQLVLGAEIARGKWRDRRTRNGGVTWRPYADNNPGLNPLDATTWQSVGSEWGGEVRLDSDVTSDALFAQSYMTLGTRLTITPGLRYGRWSGYLTPTCDGTATSLPADTCYRFEAVRANGFDPRIGLAWDMTGHGTTALKIHVGRYHQGMYSRFFDRAAGGNVYTNERFYYSGPVFPDSRRTFTERQRDAAGSAFPGNFDEKILNETGRVEGYRQPYVDQAVVSFEKSFGTSWKAEAVYTRRTNGDIVGLLDRNRARNYTLIRNVLVDHRFFRGTVLDASGERLVLPEMYVANQDLQAALAAARFLRPGTTELAGLDAAYIDGLTWNPDVVLTTVSEAKRRYDQVTLMLKSYHARWRAEGSLTGAQLRGNVAGVAGYGTTGSRFSAGPFVRPNEGINAHGLLPDALELEGKVWVTAQLRPTVQVGALFTHILGERFTPSYEFQGRYVYLVSGGTVALDQAIVRQIVGQTIFTEPRGSRQYASRDVMDAHIEWRARPGVFFTGDLFNVFGSPAITSVRTTLGEHVATDPSTYFGAPRLRVNPRTLRVGLRVDGGIDGRAGLR